MSNMTVDTDPWQVFVAALDAAASVAYHTTDDALDTLAIVYETAVEEAASAYETAMRERDGSGT